MAVSGVLTGRSGNLVEFRHVLTENSQKKNDHLHCLSQCLKKLQNDVNSCLTDIINQETTSTVPAKEVSDEEDDDSDDSEDAEGANREAQEPQPKKLRT